MNPFIVHVTVTAVIVVGHIGLLLMARALASKQPQAARPKSRELGFLSVHCLGMVGLVNTALLPGAPRRLWLALFGACMFGATIAWIISASRASSQNSSQGPLPSSRAN